MALDATSTTTPAGGLGAYLNSLAAPLGAVQLPELPLAERAPMDVPLVVTPPTSGAAQGARTKGPGKLRSSFAKLRANPILYYSTVGVAALTLGLAVGGVAGRFLKGEVTIRDTATMRLSAPSTTVAVDQTVPVSVHLSTGGEKFAGFTVSIGFDPDVFRLDTDAVESPVLTLEDSGIRCTQTRVADICEKYSIAAKVPGMDNIDPVDADILVLPFTALSDTPSSTIRLFFESDPDARTMESSVAQYPFAENSFENVSLLGSVQDLALTITPASGTGSDVSSIPTSPPAQGQLIRITGSTFDPAELTIQPGELVTWRNDDATPHSVVSDDGAFQPSSEIQQGQTFSAIFLDAGTHTYRDGVAGGTGTVIVGSPSPSPVPTPTPTPTPTPVPTPTPAPTPTPTPTPTPEPRPLSTPDPTPTPQPPTSSEAPTLSVSVSPPVARGTTTVRFTARIVSPNGPRNVLLRSGRASAGVIQAGHDATLTYTAGAELSGAANAELTGDISTDGVRIDNIAAGETVVTFQATVAPGRLTGSQREIITDTIELVDGVPSGRVLSSADIRVNAYPTPAPTAPSSVPPTSPVPPNEPPSTPDQPPPTTQTPPPTTQTPPPTTQTQPSAPPRGESTPGGSSTPAGDGGSETGTSGETPSEPNAPAPTRGGSVPVDPATVSGFADVPSTHPAAAAIATLKRLGALEGYTARTFGPDAPITRAEVVKVLQLATRTPADTASALPSDSDPANYPGDQNYVTFADAIRTALARGWMAAVGTGFSPWRWATEEAARSAISAATSTTAQSGSSATMTRGEFCIALVQALGL